MGAAVVSCAETERATTGGVERGGRLAGRTALEMRALVEVSGLEPLTFWLPARRSPS